MIEQMCKSVIVPHGIIEEVGKLSNIDTFAPDSYASGK